MTTEITDLLKEAWNCFYRGDLEQSISTCRYILELEPRQVEALCLMSRVHYRQKDLPQAKNLLEQAFRLEPRSAAAHTTRGFYHTCENHREAALNDYTEAIHLEPSYAPAYYYRAGIHQADDHRHAALNDLDEAIHHDPNLAAAYHNRATLYESMGQREAAFRDFDSALKADENFTATYLIRCHIYENMGKLELAKREAAAAIRHDIKDRRAIRSLAGFFERYGDIFYSLALAARAYRDDIEHYLSDDRDTQNFNDASVEHYRDHLKTRLQRCGDSFVQYWQVRIRWGKQVGADTLFTGQYGYGYLILARYNLWLVNLKGIHAADNSTKSLLAKAVQAFEGNEIPGDFFQKDRIFLIPHINIRSLEKGINPHTFFLNTGSHNWEIPPHDDGQGHSLEDEIWSVDFSNQSWEITPYFESDVEQVRVALELAQKRQVKELFAPLENIFSSI